MTPGPQRRGADVAILLALGLVLLARAAPADEDAAPPAADAKESKDSKDAKSSHGDLVERASSEISLYKDTDAVTVVTPTIAGRIENPLSEWGFGGRYLVDVVSAASVDIVSTASRRWHEVRQEGDFDGNIKFGDLGVGASGSVSSEPDYLAWAAGGTLSYDFAQKNVTVLAGYSFGHDTIGRHDTSFDVFSHEVVTHTANAALTIVVNKDTLLSFVTDAIFQEGDTSKPYRYIPMFTPSAAAKIQPGATIQQVNQLRLFERPLEQLPTSRDIFALTTRFAKRFSTATLRLSERLYRDTWGLTATTTDAKPVFDVSDRVSLWPHARFHAQNAVAFWERAYVANFSSSGKWQLPTFRTGDRGIGPLTGLTGGGGIEIEIRTRQRAGRLAAHGSGRRHLDQLPQRHLHLDAHQRPRRARHLGGVRMKRAAFAVILAAAAFASGCDNPVLDDKVAALGPEDPNVPVGPLHRPGQPCVACHQDGGPAALQFSFGGTVYQDEVTKKALSAALVVLTDANGKHKEAETNCVGNFYVEAVDFQPTFPVHVELVYGGMTATMLSHIGIDGSCADCHTGKDSPMSANHVYLALSPMNFPEPKCR